MWLGMPLVLLFLFAVNTAKKSAINKNERYQLIVVLLVFIFGLYHGLTNSNTQLVGVLAYARTFWIFILFYFFGYALHNNNVWNKSRLIIVLYFFISISFLLFEYFGGSDAAILLGYHHLQGGVEADWIGGHMKPFFNLKAFKDSLVYRPEGPTGSTITYAYSLFSIPLLFRVKSLAFSGGVLLSLVIIFLLGSKGGVIVLILFIFSSLYIKCFKSDRLLYLILVVTAVLVSMTQIASNDNHGLGLVGGILNLFDHPFGQGLGVGGNLSGEHFNAVDGARSFMYGSESIFGVLFTQIGFLFLLLLLFLARLIKKGNSEKKSRLIKSLCILVMIFGMSQEEAWSTLAAIPFIFLGAQVSKQQALSRVRIKGLRWLL
jgi:hypothetical protein